VVDDEQVAPSVVDLHSQWSARPKL
jgi:hypothetical protein